MNHPLTDRQHGELWDYAADNGLTLSEAAAALGYPDWAAGLRQAERRAPPRPQPRLPYKDEP